MADQCIVCLDTLETVSSGTPQLPTEVDAPPEPAVAAIEASKANESSPHTEKEGHHHGNDDSIALIQVCGHVLHDSCLREWTAKANSCPICRQLFHKVHVYDKVGGKFDIIGNLLSTYEVRDKKQVAEFDPQAWLDENPEEEEESTPCPVCLRSDDEEVLLLCDGCDTPYHTHCIGLDAVPRGSWFCMECAEALGPEVTGAPVPTARNNSGANSRSRPNYFPRTQASMRRARQRARSDNWQGAWGVISGRIWDALSIDLDYHDDDEALEDYRRMQQVRDRERREHERWQQRLNIASRLGARDVFANSIQNVFAQRRSTPPAARPVEQVQQTAEERRAWAAFEKSRAEQEDGRPSSSRKRKAPSVTDSPAAEASEQTERKLKRPRTRRVPTSQVQNGEGSSRSAVETGSPRRNSGNNSLPNASSPAPATQAAPSFLSSLLKEVEMSTPSDDENIRNVFGRIPGANDGYDAPSPASSPSPSGHNSPRALSTTPPPQQRMRPSSPHMTLSSHIEPIYPKPNYLPTRSSPDNSDSESSIRQPRPRRPQPAAAVRAPRTEEASPSRAVVPLETKESITNIVREALRPHWKSEKMTATQYATINREVSHKLYAEIKDPSAIDEETKMNWERLATREVERAISELKS